MSSASRQLLPLAKLLEALEVMRQLDAEMPTQTVSTFLAIAETPGLTFAQLGERLGLSASSTSRNVAYLSKYHSFNKPGHDLVETETDPKDRRMKVAKLTRKGERLAEKLNERLG